jgi:hypothetical protein
MRSTVNAGVLRRVIERACAERRNAPTEQRG